MASCVTSFTEREALKAFDVLRCNRGVEKKRQTRMHGDRIITGRITSISVERRLKIIKIQRSNQQEVPAFLSHHVPPVDVLPFLNTLFREFGGVRLAPYFLK